MDPKTVTVVGIGRLGICLALCLEKAGYHVLGVDTSPDYIASINDKTLKSSEPNVEEYLKNSSNFRATDSLEEGINFSDICLIVVPTNTILEEQTYDHTILSSILTRINSLRIKNKDLSICSTVFPGYIRNIGSKLIQDCINTTLSYNPEFIAQGSIIEGLRSPDLVLIGENTTDAGDKLQAIYQNLCINSPEICRMSPSSAEITKLAINCFITAKIAFANLIGDIADETPGANKREILKSIGKDQRIGSKNLVPGYGFGGPCFPRDNQALGNYASLLGIDPFLFRATDQSNKSHGEFIAKKILQKNLSSYVFDDVCYKPKCPVAIIENSPKLAVAKRLADLGKEVTILDTDNVIQKVKQQYGSLFKYIIQETT